MDPTGAESLSNRRSIEKTMLVIVLPAVAGAVNGSGLFIVGAYTSHITGTLARIGDEFAQGHWAQVKLGLGMVAFFLSGAMTAAVLVERSAKAARGKYVTPLCVEAALLGFVAFGAALFPPGVEPYRGILTLVLSAVMGMQNAMVTRISGAVVRTTHMTGVLTDLGIELVHLGLFLRQKLLGLFLPGSGAVVILGAQRLIFHLTLLVSFATGAIVGPLAYLRMGPMALLAPSLVLLGLAYVDARIGLRFSEKDALGWRDS